MRWRRRRYIIGGGLVSAVDEGEEKQSNDGVGDATWRRWRISIGNERASSGFVGGSGASTSAAMEEGLGRQPTRLWATVDV